MWPWYWTTAHHSLHLPHNKTMTICIHLCFASWTVRYPLYNYIGIWREMHLEAHASGNTCVLEVGPKSQLPYICKWTRLGSWSQISTSLRLFHYTPLHFPLHSLLHSVCNSYVGTLPLRTSWDRRQSTFATTSLRYMCVMFHLSTQVSTKCIILCTNLTVRLK